MEQTLFYNSLGIGCLCVAALVFLLLFTRDSDNRNAFVWASLCTIIAIVCELGCMKFDHSEHRVLDIIFNAVGFSITPLIPLTLYPLFSSERKQLPKACYIPAILNAIACLLSAFVPIIFTIDPVLGYQRASCYFIFILSYTWALAVLLYTMSKLVLDRYRPFQLPLVFLLVFVVLGTTIQLVFPMVHTTWLCVTIGLILNHAFWSALQTIYDVTTGIYNRNMYEKGLKEAEAKGKACLVIFDVDNFKMYNDTYGHPYGDRILTTIAYCLFDSFTGVGNAFRIGGDEFFVISYAREEEVGKAIDTFNATLLLPHEGIVDMPTVSYGLSLFDVGKDGKISKTVREADVELYKKKRAKKECDSHFEAKRKVFLAF